MVFDKTGTLTLGEPAGLRSEAQVSADVLASAAASGAQQPPSLRPRHRQGRARGGHSRPGRPPTFAKCRATASNAIGQTDASAWALPTGAASSRTQMALRRFVTAPPTGRHTGFVFADQRCGRRCGRRCAELATGGLSHTEMLSGDRSSVVERRSRAAGHCDVGAPASLPADKIARLEELRPQRPQGADGRRRAQRCARAGRRPRLALAVHRRRYQPDGRRRHLPGRALAPVLEALAVARAAHRMALQNFAIAIGYNSYSCRWRWPAMSRRCSPRSPCRRRRWR